MCISMQKYLSEFASLALCVHCLAFSRFFRFGMKSQYSNTPHSNPLQGNKQTGLRGCNATFTCFTAIYMFYSFIREEHQDYKESYFWNVLTISALRRLILREVNKM